MLSGPPTIEIVAWYTRCVENAPELKHRSVTEPISTDFEYRQGVSTPCVPSVKEKPPARFRGRLLTISGSERSRRARIEQPLQSLFEPIKHRANASTNHSQAQSYPQGLITDTSACRKSSSLRVTR
jgi:hypothetical protein